MIPGGVVLGTFLAALCFGFFVDNMRIRTILTYFSSVKK